MSRVYLLGGHQTDFKRNFAREGKGIFDLLKEPVEGALAATGIAPEEVQVAHVGNFVAELFCGQGQLGGLFAAIHPRFSGLPAARHGVFAPDRLQHASLAFSSGLAIGVVSREPVAAASGAVALALAKELWDARRSHFDGVDLAASVLGAALATIATIAIDR